MEGEYISLFPRVQQLNHHISHLAAARRGDRIEDQAQPSQPEDLINLGVPPILIDPLIGRHNAIMDLATAELAEQGVAPILAQEVITQWNGVLTSIANLIDLSAGLRSELRIH